MRLCWLPVLLLAAEMPAGEAGSRRPHRVWVSPPNSRSPFGHFFFGGRDSEKSLHPWETWENGTKSSQTAGENAKGREGLGSQRKRDAAFPASPLERGFPLSPSDREPGLQHWGGGPRPRVTVGAKGDPKFGFPAPDRGQE